MSGQRIQAIDCSLDAMKSLLWAHDNAERLKTLITLKQQWYERGHCRFWTDWVRDVFDVRTANDFGLGIWARILDIPLAVEVPGSRDKQAFGFGTEHSNFAHGNFARGKAGQLFLTTRQKRLVIRLRYFQLTSRGTVPQINAFLHELFGADGRVFVVDPLDMSIALYFFSFDPGSELALILEQYDLLPRPAGVGARYLVQVKPSWGFGENHLNFSNGNFGV